MIVNIYTREECKKLIDELEIISYKIQISVYKSKISQQLLESILFHTSRCRDSISERIYWILNDIEDYPLCQECGKQFQPRFYGLKNGYRSIFCSIRCGSLNSEVQEKNKKTCLENLGVEHPAQSIKVQQKMQATSEERYGVKFAAQSPVIQEKTKQTNRKLYNVDYTFQSEKVKHKSRQTNLQRRNVEYPMQCESVRHKSRETCKEKYNVESISRCPNIKEKSRLTNLQRRNVEYPMQCKLVKQKNRETCKERYGVESISQYPEIRNKAKQTCKDRFGYENPGQSPEIREKVKHTCKIKFGFENVMQNKQVKQLSMNTCEKRHGFKHPLQNMKFFKKMLKSSYSIKKMTLPSGKEISYQGYENIAILKLLEDGYLEEQIIIDTDFIPQIQYQLNNENKVYYPDIFIPCKNLIIEVKSIWTYLKDLDKNLTKRQACLDQGYLFQFWICSDKKLLEIK